MPRGIYAGRRWHLTSAGIVARGFGPSDFVCMMLGMPDWLIGLCFLAFGALATAAIFMVRGARIRARLEAEVASGRDRATVLATQLDEMRADRDETRATLETQRTARETAERSLAAAAERIDAVTDAEQRLKDSFRAAGAEALAANSEQFLRQAQTTLEKVLTDAKGDVARRQQAIEHLVRPMREALERQDRAVREIEKERHRAYAGLEQQIKQMTRSNERLDRETGRLVSALSRPNQRGQWGEMALRNAVELAGMTAHCDFREQVSDGDRRPDMVVSLPGEGMIAVDSKVPLEAYLDALEPDTDRDALLERHATHVERHFRALSKREYWKQFERTPRLVVMFLPLESALVAALEKKPHLHAEAMKSNVLITTPTLLVALLRAIAYGWQQESVAENARAIANAGSELYDRLAKFVEKLQGVGTKLGQATRSYNEAVGSLETRLLPSGRRLRELEASRGPVISTPARLDVEPREITHPELQSIEEEIAGETLPVDQLDL